MMIRTRMIFTAIGLGMLAPVAAFAETNASTIEQLQQQIQMLQRQLQTLGTVPHPTHSATVVPLHSIPSVHEKVDAVHVEGVTQNIPNFTHDLFFGMKNNPDVSDLQEFLTDQGYYAGPISGNFGLLTVSSVKKFQAVNGVKSTGYFGLRSRAIANEIIQKLVEQICPREEGCEEGVLPVEKIAITAESALEGVVGEQLVIRFRASGGSGDYDINGESRMPGGFKFGIPACEDGKQCMRDTITLSGVPARSGVFDVVIFARDILTSPDVGIAYGKERFTVVIKDKISSGKAPVISGVKGPTTLHVGEEGLWSVNAYDPQHGGLSYRVVWGDEAMMSNKMSMPSMPEMTPFRQTATFSHSYNTPGVYAPVFSVVNESGLGVKTSLSVNVGKIIETPRPIPVPVGALTIDPSYAALKIGESVRVKAIFTPPRPACLDAIPACEIPERAPYEVDASFVSDSPKIASIETVLAACPVPLSGTPATCSLPMNSVRGVSAGDTIVTASYTENGRTHTAKMKVMVGGADNTPPKITGFSGIRSSIQPGHEVSFSWNATDADGDNLSWSVSWGDNSGLNAACQVPNPQNKQGWNFTASHVWAAAGTYVVKAVVNDCRGGEDTHAFNVTMGNTAQPSITVVSPNGGEVWPVGSTQVIRWQFGNIPSTAQFSINLVSDITTINIASYLSTSDSFLWVIPKDLQPQKYKIEVVAFLPNSNSDFVASDRSDTPFSIVSSVVSTTTSPRISIFIANQTERTVQINGGVQNASGSLSFDWGDGNKETGYFPLSHTYGQDGQYVVYVCASNIQGQTCAPQIVVDAFQLLKGSLSEPTVAGMKVSVNGVVAYSPGSISKIIWNWGDGDAKTEDAQWFPASHTYTQSGTYLIHMTGWANDGKRIILTKYIVILCTPYGCG